MYKGPCLNPQLSDLFVKFRLYHIAVTTDVEKAYFQINVHKSHRDYLRFLWFSDINSENPVTERYRFCKILFCATCAQFFLNATIRKHASKYEKVDAEFVRKLRDHFYVDDLNSGAYNVENGFDLYKKVKINLMNASFDVRKWQTNSESLRSLIYNCDKSFDSENFTTAENEKVLGVTWHEKNDVLIFGLRDILNAAVNITLTKRNVSSVIASVYDTYRH